VIKLNEYGAIHNTVSAKNTVSKKSKAVSVTGREGP
jgi:hypothetical protein